MKRRTCLKNSTLWAASALLMKNSFLKDFDLLKNIGIQLFSLPKVLEENFEEGIKSLSSMGYSEIELYGPYPYSNPVAQRSWDAITPMLGFSGSGYFGHSAEEVRAILSRYNLRVPSIHTDLESLRTRMPQFAEAAEILGFNYITLPAIPPQERKTLDDYKRIADEFNKIGEAANKVGLKFAYHNHGYGLHEVDGIVPLNLLIERTDADKVYLEMDVYWTTAGSADPIAYLESYPDRYHLMHLKDMKQQVRFEGDGGDPSQWIALFPYMTTAGDGVLDLNGIIKKAKETGVKHFFVEQDMVADPYVALPKSYNYLQKL